MKMVWIGKFGEEWVCLEEDCPQHDPIFSGVDDGVRIEE